MATFWERLTGLGDGASEPLDLEVFQNALTLWGTERITRTDAVDWMGLTESQTDELQAFVFARQPGSFPERIQWALEIRIIVSGARAGRSALDSVQNVWTALSYEPIPPG